MARKKTWNYGNLPKKKKKPAPDTSFPRYRGGYYEPTPDPVPVSKSKRVITKDEYAAMQSQSGQLHDTLKGEEFTPYAKIALASGPPVPLMFSYDFPAHGQYFTVKDYDTETFKGTELVGKEDISGSGGQKEAEQYFLEQVARHPGTTTTASEKISGKGGRTIRKIESGDKRGIAGHRFGYISKYDIDELNLERERLNLPPLEKKHYGREGTRVYGMDNLGQFIRDLSDEPKISEYSRRRYEGIPKYDQKIKGTGYDLYSRIKPGTQYMGINPHKGWGDGMRSREEIFNTVNHELEHYGYDEWHKIVEKDSRLYNKLLIKYGKGIINNALLDRWDEFDPELRGHPLGSGTFMAEHPAIYSQSSWKPYREPPYTIDEEGNKKWTEDGRTPKEMTPVLKEIIDQEILPYFKKLLPSLKKYKSLQGPAYGLTKTTGRTMKKRDYQESLLRDKASYAVESRKRRHYESGDKERDYVLQNLRGLKYDVPARIYKGDWNYRDKALEKIDILDRPEVVPYGDFSLPKKTRKSTKSKKRSWNY